MPAARIAWWKPRLLITVATTVSSRSSPALAQRQRAQAPGSGRRRPPRRRRRRPGSGRRRRRGRCRDRRRLRAPRRAAASRWVEPTPSLMLSPSGLGGDRGDVGAGPPVAARAPRPTRRRARSRRTTCSPSSRVGHGLRAGGPDSARRRRRRPRTRPTAAPIGRVSGSAADRGLDLGLDVVGQLVPAAREQLDAVVGHRVVRGRQHDAEVGAVGRGQEGDGRRRQHAEPAARRRRPRSSPATTAASSISPLARGSRPDHGQRAGASRRARPAPGRPRWPPPARARGSGRRSPARGRRRCRTEPATHGRLSAWSTEEPCGPSSGRTSCAP